MPHIRTNWANYQSPAINAANLNNIEAGIWYALVHSGGVRNTAEFLQRNPGSTTGGLAEAIADLGGAPGVVFAAPHNHPIPAGGIPADTIPANIHLIASRGATLTIANAVTLTINGTIEAGLYQIFSWVGTGAVVFAAYGAKQEVWVEWWGAIGDDDGAGSGTDNTAAIIAAMTAAGNGTLRLGEGRFKTTSELATLGIVIIGAGRDKTWIINANGAGGHCFRFLTGARRVRIKDVYIKGLAGSGDGIYSESGVGYVTLEMMHIEPVGVGINAPLGTCFLWKLDEVRALGGTGGFVARGSGTAVWAFIKCYANNSSGYGYEIAEIQGLSMISCAADNNDTGFRVAGTGVLMGCSAEVNTTRGFLFDGIGGIVVISPFTYSQLSPFKIDAGGADITLMNPRTESTPAGNAIDVTAGSNGNNILIGSKLDAPIVVVAGGRLGRPDGFWASVPKVNNYVIGAGETGTRFSTLGAGGPVIFTLPVSIAGMRFSFIKMANQICRIDPNGAEVIRSGAGGKYLQLDNSIGGEALGTSVTLECLTAGAWEFVTSHGTYSFEA